MQDVWLDDLLHLLAAGFTGAGTGQFTTAGSLVYPATFDSSPYYVVNANGPAPPWVPEPASLALLLIAAASLAFMRRRR